MGSYFSISVSATENSYSIENNTSNVTVKLLCNGNNGWAEDNPSYWLKVNGDTVASGTYNFSYSSFTVCSWTGNIPHNADGTGFITYQGYYQGTDKPNGDTTAVYTLNLTTIPRASEILNGTTQRAIDGTISFSVDKKNENFVDKLTIYPTSNTSLATVVSPYTTGSTFTIGTATFNSIKALAPTTSYTSMVVQVETFTSSGAVVGTASSQFRGSFSVTAPTISPTWSAFPTEEIVTGYDDVTVSLGTAAVADLGTTISAYEFTIGTTTITATGYSVYFDSVEDNDVKVKIIDRRGLSTTISSSNLFDVIQYFKPTINATITRSPSLIDTGAVLTFDGEYTWKNQDQEYNHPPMAQYKINNGNWTTISSFTYQGGNYDGGVTFASGTFDAAQEYSVYLRVYDGFDDNYSEKQLILSKAAVTFDLDLTNLRAGVGQPVPVATSGSDGLVSGGLIVSGKIKEEGQYLEDKYGGINQQQLLNLIYPVGSIYMSARDVSPASFLGGTWEQIKDRFLLSLGDTYNTAGATGGEATHTLTTDEMPSHNHTQYGSSGNHNDGKRRTIYNDYGDTSYWELYQKTGSTGGGQAHNNMPPYLVVYMWKRTA